MEVWMGAEGELAISWENIHQVTSALVGLACGWTLQTLRGRSQGKT